MWNQMFRKIEFPCHLGSRGIESKRQSFTALTEFRNVVGGVLFIAYLENDDTNEWYNAIISAIDRFVSGDYGNFYEDEEYISLGHEYGSYDSPFGNTVYDGSIVIHAEKHIDSFGTPADAVIFFWYER